MNRNNDSYQQMKGRGNSHIHDTAQVDRQTINFDKSARHDDVGGNHPQQIKQYHNAIQFNAKNAIEVTYFPTIPAKMQSVTDCPVHL